MHKYIYKRYIKKLIKNCAAMLQFCNYPKLRIRLVKPRFRVHLLMNSMNVRLFSPFELKEQCYRLRITNLNNYRHSLIFSSPNCHVLRVMPFKNNNDEIFKSRYRDVRNKLKTKIKSAKRDFYQRAFSSENKKGVEDYTQNTSSKPYTATPLRIEHPVCFYY